MKKNILLLIIISLLVSNPVVAMKRKRDDGDDKRPSKKRKIKDDSKDDSQEGRSEFERQYDMYRDPITGIYRCPQCSREEYAGVTNVHNLISHLKYYGHGFGLETAIALSEPKKKPEPSEESPDLEDVIMEDAPVSEIPGLKNLPNEIKCEIFSYLPIHYLLHNVKRANKELCSLVDESIKKVRKAGTLNLKITNDMLDAKFSTLLSLIKFLEKHAPHIRINLDMSNTNITDFHLGCLARNCPPLRSLDVHGCSGVTLQALKLFFQAVKNLMLKSRYGINAGMDIGPREPIQIHVQDEDAQGIWPPITTEIRIREGDEETGIILPERKVVTISRGKRRFPRNINFRLTILPALQQPYANADCAFYSLFNAACLVPQGDRNLMHNRERFVDLLWEWRQYLCGQDEDETFLCSRSMELLIRNQKFFQNLRNNNVSNVSIVDSLDELEAALQTARRDEYEVGASQLAAVSRDVRRLRAGLEPEVLQLIGRHRYWRYTPSMLQNIRNFRNNGTEQIIILNTGRGHWVTLRLFRQDGQNHIEITNSVYHDVDASIEIARRVYQIFVTDPLPLQQQQ